VLTAVTGGIAEGKSTVLACLAELGHKIASSDEIARRIFVKSEVQDLLAAVAGLSLPVDRGELRNKLFESPAIRRMVNSIMHPRIREALLTSEAEFIEVPLLIETCMQGAFDSVWVVTCGQREQRIRLLARYGAHSDLSAMLAAQLPTSMKIPFADEVIRTNCPLESVRRSISRALERRNELS
jgi:dephospho-CoA kinase